MADIYTTADIVKALAQEREKKLPQRPSFFSGIVPQVSAQDAARNRPEPVERASLFPLATYPDGSTRLALPGMIAEDIPRAFTAPARAYRGEIADEDMIAEGLNFGGTMAMGGSVVPKPSNAAGMFGGRLAKTADHAKLAQAEEMAAKGLPREDIWSQTGWFKGVDGKWRFEIDDSKSVFDAGPRNAKNSGLVDKMIDHPAMFDAYPAAGDSIASWTVNPALKSDSGSHKAFNYGADGKPRYSAIDVNARTEAGGRSTALHELQHDIQMREGFARGGNLDEFTKRIGIPFTNSELRIAQPNKYKRQAGEVEARAVEARRDLTPEQRASRPPWLDYDVPESQQIVRFNANSTESAAPGVVMAEAARQPTPIRAYHGSRSSWDGTFDPSRSSHSVPSTFFGTQADANYFASSLGNHPSGSSIRPVDIDATGMRSVDWPSISGGGADPHLYRSGPMDALLRDEHASGAPGVVIKNIRTDEGLPVGDYVAMLENGRGRVRSATTGDLLFENGANAAAPGVIVSEAARPPRPVQMEVPFYRGSGHAQTSVDYSKPYWGTTDRSTADFYARSMAQAEGATPNVTPAVARFRNPMLVDAQGAGFSEIPFDGKRWSTDDLAAAAKERGHDGLVIDRLYDGGRWDPDEGLPATVAALGPGTVSSAFDPNTILYANSKSSSAPGVLAAEAADKPRGIRAYHGSPHDFDRFDLSKIGTGEGAQAYGHGLYFAENEGVARSYRDALSVADGNDVGKSMGAKLLAQHGGNVEAAIADIKSRPNWNVSQSFREALSYIESGGTDRPSGRMYEVAIHADPADFLDWDKPLSQQSERVKVAFERHYPTYDYARKFYDPKSSRIVEHEPGQPLPDLPPEQLLTNVETRDRTTKALREAGIPGIRYLDQGSRTAGEGSRNYVVFDDALVEILRKYMNPPTAAAPGVLMYEGAKDARQ